MINVNGNLYIIALAGIRIGRIHFQTISHVRASLYPPSSWSMSHPTSCQEKDNSVPSLRPYHTVFVTLKAKAANKVYGLFIYVHHLVILTLKIGCMPFFISPSTKILSFYNYRNTNVYSPQRSQSRGVLPFPFLSRPACIMYEDFVNPHIPILILLEYTYPQNTLATFTYLIFQYLKLEDKNRQRYSVNNGQQSQENTVKAKR